MKIKVIWCECSQDSNQQGEIWYTFLELNGITRIRDEILISGTPQPILTNSWVVKKILLSLHSMD